MTKTLLPLFLLPLSAFAQPVLQFADLDLEGNIYHVHILSALNGANLITDGANASWDISAASHIMIPSGTQFVAPSATPYAASYPTSNLAQWVSMPGGLEYSYLVADAQGLHLLADGVDSTGGNVFVDGKTLLKFPFAFNESFTDTYVLGGLGQNQTRTYSAYGTLTTHVGTFTNVVKVTSASGNADFYTSGSIEPLFHYEPDGTSLLFEPTMVGIVEQSAQLALVAYPNPATEHVTINGLTAGTPWQLLDTQGRIIVKGMANNNSTIALMSIAPGRYVLRGVERGVVRTAVVVKQ